MSEQKLSLMEMAEEFDVTPRTLRYYEYIELLSPERDGRARWYSGREIARMILILRGRRFGFSLEDIRQWLLIYEEKGTQAQMEAWVELANGQLDTLRAQKAELEDTIHVLEKLRDETQATLT